MIKAWLSRLALSAGIDGSWLRGLADLCHCSVTVLMMARWRSMVLPSIPIRIETDQGPKGSVSVMCHCMLPELLAVQLTKDQPENHKKTAA